MVLIEAKASGISVIQEIRRLMRAGEFSLVGDTPRGDKTARLHAASPAFSAGLVYAPNKRWAQMVIDEAASFPRSRWKDLTDTVSAGINKLREMGLLKHTTEAAEDRMDELIALGGRNAMRQRSPRDEYGV
jgi:predicted phage terminase large subunit-like protein